MLAPKHIIEDEGIREYLETRWLIQQYQKAKQYILQWFSHQTQFKERQPKGTNIRSFRINKQYRAIGSFDSEWDLRIFSIDNHS